MQNKIPPSKIPPPSIEYNSLGCLILIFAFLAVALIGLSGCSAFDNLATDPDQMNAAQNVIKGTGALLAPATGGISAWVTHGLAALLPTIVSIQQAWKKRRLAQAIMHIDANEKSDNAADQVPAGVHRKTVREITG